MYLSESLHSFSNTAQQIADKIHFSAQNWRHEAPANGSVKENVIWHAVEIFWTLVNPSLAVEWRESRIASLFVDLFRVIRQNHPLQDIVAVEVDKNMYVMENGRPATPEQLRHTWGRNPKVLSLKDFRYLAGL